MDKKFSAQIADEVDDTHGNAIDYGDLRQFS